MDKKVICGMRTSSGKPCQNPAGWGTNHPGIGPCRYHEKDQPLAGRHLPSYFLLDNKLRDDVVRMLENDTELNNLRYELAVLKTRFLREADTMAPSSLASLAATIARLTNTIHDIEVGRHLYIHVNVLGLVLQAVGQVAAQYLPEDSKEAFAQDLRISLKNLLPRTTTKEIATSGLIKPIEEVIEG